MTVPVLEFIVLLTNVQLLKILFYYMSMIIDYGWHNEYEMKHSD